MANDNGAEVRRQAASKIVSALGFPTPEVTQEEKDIYLHRILDTLYRNKRPESPSKKAEANTGLSYATSAEPASNVSVTDESYSPASGFDANDILVPNKPNIDWFSGENAKGVPPEMVIPSGLPVATSAASQEAPAQQPTETKPQVDLSKLSVAPMRRRRSSTVEALAAAKDVMDFVSGIDPNSYIGKTLEVMNKYDKTRMEEDPEGYQADLNRAKVLSQKAQEETDPARKAIYGRQIKKLLPKETQGLSDEIAADYFTAGLDNKIKLEQLKGYNKLQEIEARNKGNITVQSMKNMSAKEINDAKMQTQREISDLNREYQYAKLSNDNERAKIIQDMIADRMINLANINNAAQIEKEAYKADRAMEREVYRADAAQKRVETQQAGAIQRAMVNKGQLPPEVRRENWGMTKARFKADMDDMQKALDLMQSTRVFGLAQRQLLEKGQGSAKDRQTLGYIKGVLTEAVRKLLKNVRDSAGTGKAVDSDKEAERALGYLSADSGMDQDVIYGALKQFMEQAYKDMSLAELELFGENKDYPLARKQTGSNIKSVKKISK